MMKLASESIKNDEEEEGQHTLQCGEEHTNNDVFDFRMISAKCSFFFTHALYGCSIPYLTVFLTSVGLTASQAGFISGLRTVVSFICGPAWGALADYTGRRRLVYVLLAVGTISTLFSLPWIASCYTVDEDMHPSISNGSLSNKTEMTNQMTLSNYANRRLFYVMLISLLISSAFDLPLLGYHDALVVQVTNTRAVTRPTTFGAQRVFGSIGFAFSNFICGFAADQYAPPQMSSYTVVFYVLLSVGLIMIPFGLYLHSMTSPQSARRSSTPNKNLKHVLRLTIRTCSTCTNVWFFSTVFIMGLASALVYGFVFLYMEKEMNASKTIMGLSLLVGSCLEVFVFPFASKIMKIFGGPIPCIIISASANFARFLMFSFVKNPWLIVPIQSLTAVAFALFWACAIEQTNLISPKQINTIMISILNCIHFSLSHLVGSMTGGVLYKRYGGRHLFLGSSILFLLWTVISLIFWYGRKYYHQDTQAKSDLIISTFQFQGVNKEEEILMDAKI